MSSSTNVPKIRIEIYRDENKKWRWRLISKATIRALSSQGYVSKQGCLDAIRGIRSIIQDADIIEI